MSPAFLLILLAAAGTSYALDPPNTRKVDYKETLHGVEITDPYRWLEDDDSSETKEWIAAQSAYTRKVLGSTPLEQIGQRLAALMGSSQMSVPQHVAGVYYFSKRGPGDEGWSTYRRRGVQGQDEVILDAGVFRAREKSDPRLMVVSENGRVLAYSIRRGGEDETQIRFKDLETLQDLPVVIERHLNRGFTLNRQGTEAYYTIHDRDKGPRVEHIDLRSGAKRKVFGGEFTPSTFINPGLIEDDRYLLLDVQHGWAQNDLYLQDLQSEEPAKLLVAGLSAKFQAARATKGHLLVRTTWNAPNGRAMLVDLRTPQSEHWKEIIAESTDALDRVLVVNGEVFAHYVHNVTTQIRRFTLRGEPRGTVNLPGIGIASLVGYPDQALAFLDFRSYNSPATTYTYDTSNGELRVFSRPDIPFDASRFEVNQIWYSSKDGTRVPMFLFHRKGLKPSGATPTLLEGYGGFGSNFVPTFLASAALWVEQGGIYAVPNIRGGGEFGEAWHRAGMLEKKQNVFDDFIGAAEWLIRNKYTSPKKLAIRGYSNGGLLVGAAITQRPDLFKAALCEHPDLDIVGAPRFRNFNKPALLEYGDASKAEQFPFVRAYSPYQNVRDGAAYPAVLLTTGHSDTRVPPLQARKMTARLQAASSSGSPVLLLYDMEAGHAGGRSQTKLVEYVSATMAFLFQQLDLKWTPPPPSDQPR